MYGARRAEHNRGSFSCNRARAIHWESESDTSGQSRHSRPKMRFRIRRQAHRLDFAMKKIFCSSRPDNRALKKLKSPMPNTAANAHRLPDAIGIRPTSLLPDYAILHQLNRKILPKIRTLL